jgi:RNA polymerase sigma-70 factor (ECF subfamily)
MEMAISLMCQFTAEPESIRGLIHDAKAGDLAAFEQIVTRYERIVLRVARRLLADSELARDAAQEVFLRLHSKLGKFQEEKDLAPWLYRMTVNLCHDLRRRSKPGVTLDLAPALRDAALDPEQAMELLQRQELVAAALEELSPREREAIVLRDLEGLSTTEVARLLRSSEGTVRSQISTGRVKIKQFILAQFGRRP